MKLLRLSPLLLALGLIGTTQLSCSVNDYCLNCEKGDGGHGSNDGNNGDGNGSNDANIDAGCVPTGGPEICNGKDDDCNGLVDDNAEHEGEPCDNLNGACAGGVKICTAGAMSCTKLPKPEVCDGIDNNCSGPLSGNPSGADEGDPGPPAAMGAPESGVQCGNGTDDDGDGVKDDGCPGTGGKCGTDQGECTAGQFHCDPATGTVKCFGFIDHTGDAEICDGKDNNCNGQFDEGITFVNPNCGPATNTGACEFGTKACAAGQVVCNGAIFPAFDVCNNIDDDCDGAVDQNTNKSSDINNCGYCGDICPTAANANTNCTVKARPAMGAPETGTNCGDGIDNDADGVKDDGCTEGTCGYSCQPGYKDLDGMAGNGCEFGPCFPTGVEECDGLDNDCNGVKDDGLTPPVGFCAGKGECGTFAGMPMNAGYSQNNPPTATCNTLAGAWQCNYTGQVTTEANGQRYETKCDGLDNNCDGNIDENQPNLGITCHEDRETVCSGNADEDGDGKVNDGCVVAPATAPAVKNAPETGTQCNNATDDDNDGVVNDGCSETGAQCLNAIDDDGDLVINDGCPESGVQCNNNTDDDGDGVVNDGCPAASQLGVCQGTGSYKCDPTNLDGPAVCTITTAGSSPSAEACDNKDNDCDGTVDNGGSTGNLTMGQEWISLGNGHQMMRYEASRPDATSATAGTSSAIVCSKASALPWINVKYEDALAACQSIGAQLCTESQWHHACSVASVATAPPVYPLAYSGAAASQLVVEAEDYSSLGVGAGAVNGAETTCNDTVDSDGDGVINDGCPIVGTAPETMCNDTVDSDNDGTVNDGCPAYGPAAETVCNEAPATGAGDDDKDGVINDGCPVSGTAEVDCRDGTDDDGDGKVNDGCPAVGPTWVPDYTAGFSGVSAMEATPNLSVSLTTAQAPTIGARMDYAVNIATGGTFHVWVKMYSNNTNTSPSIDHKVYVGMQISSGTTLVPPQAPTANYQYNTATTNLDNTWQWRDSGTFVVTAGIRYVSVYMAEDGVKVDRIALVQGSGNPGTGETLATKGNIWAYSTPNTLLTDYSANTCNGHDYRTFSINTVARTAAGLATITTTGNHSFVVGDLVQILGTANTTFEGTYTVTSVPSATSFTYQQSSTTPVASTSGGTGSTATEAKDPVLATGSLTSCYANVGTGIFDMSGNVREWTLAHSVGENPIRGGASNGTALGTSCALNFTLADDTFFFPNIGFRCCRNN